MKSRHYLLFLVAVKAAVAGAQVPCLLDLGPDFTVCNREPFALSAHVLQIPPATSVVYEWSGAFLSCSDCPSPLVVAPTAGSYTYVLTVRTDSCTLSDSLVVHVIVKETLLSLPADAAICLGDSVLLNSASDTAAAYIWTATHPNFDTVRTAAPVVVPVQSATYYGTVEKGGCVFRDSVRLQVVRAELVVSSDTVICRGQSVRLLALTDVSGGVFTWRRLSDGVILSTAQSVSVSPEKTTAYAITMEYGNGCRRSDTVVVEVKGEALTIQFPSDPRLCPGEPLVLNLAPATGIQYLWSAEPPDPGLVVNAPSPVVSPTRSTVYTVTAQEADCTLKQSLLVSVFSATLTVSADTVVCAGDRAALSAIGAGPNGCYLWSTGETSPMIFPAPTVSTLFTVAYFYGDTCALYDTIRVSTAPAFSLQIASVPDTSQINLGQSIQLFAAVSPPQDLSGFSFAWQETTIGTKPLPFSAPNIEVRPSSNDTASAAVRYTVRAVSPQGCVRTAERLFQLLFPLVRFPNAFTPNGDGYNDYFEMLVLEGQARIERMQIFNRWGGLVFDSAETNARWDGTVNGQPAPADVYLYRISWRRSDGAMMPLAVGDVTLIR